MKKLIIIPCILVVCIIFIPHNKIMTSNKNFNVYIKEDGQYVKQSSGNFPKGGYVLNTETSTCTGGSTLSQNPTTKTISISSNTSEKCDLYFDEEEGAVGKIGKLVSQADTKSTDVIDVTEPILLSKNEYVFKFNGIVNPSDYQYDSLEDCQSGLDWFLNEFGSNSSGTCQLDSSTNKYDIIAGGDSRDSEHNQGETSYSYTYNELSYCEEILEERNFQNTSCTQITITYEQEPSCSNTFAYDGTSDNNLRYVGKNPCNYVTFNGEEAGWRIIGLMNNIDDGTGNMETRLKLIRTTSLGSYSWDTSDSSVNKGYGLNDWSQADLMHELNGDYLNTTLTSNTMWYNEYNNGQTAEYDYTKGLSQAAQNLVGDAKWNLGGYHNTASSTASIFYTAERGTTTYSTSNTCDDGACPRATEWTGKVALMYPSDYGFAVGGAGIGETVRNNCLTRGLDRGYAEAFNVNASFYYCYDFNYLNFDNSWFLTPSNLYATNVLYFEERGRVEGLVSYGLQKVYPVVYLESSVDITEGDGSSENPYTFN